MAICGAYFKLPSDKDIWQYFRAHYRPFFPALGDRTLFVRQAAHLWQIKAAIQQRLTHISGQAHDPSQPIDTLPLPVCGYTRSGRDRCLKPYADYGYCAAKDMYYYGFKLGRRISRMGMITQLPLLVARPHDINHLEALVEDFRGLVPADKGFIDTRKHTLVAERHALLVVTPPRARMQSEHPPPHGPSGDLKAMFGVEFAGQCGTTPAGALSPTGPRGALRRAASARLIQGIKTVVRTGAVSWLSPPTVKPSCSA